MKKEDEKIKYVEEEQEEVEQEETEELFLTKIRFSE